MGFIDTESAYTKIMKWDWGNSGGDIYHDPETRKNAFSYRASIARVVEKLIDEKKFDKAENLLDLAMKNMPVNKFELYTLVEPFLNAYYKINKPKKARKVYQDLATVYKGHITYYKTLNIEEQIFIVDDILTDLERYKTIIITAIENKDLEIIKTEIPNYISTLEPFKPLMKKVRYGITLDKLISGLYKVNEGDEARNLYLKEVNKIQKNLGLIDQLSTEQVYSFYESILTDQDDYKKLLRIIDKHEDSLFFKTEMKKFIKISNKIDTYFKAVTEELEE